MACQNLRNQILNVCTRLHARNMLASADGNVSALDSDGNILITPTGKNKSQISAEDMAVITCDNKILTGKPSGERLMHLAVYAKCTKARAVVHAHPPTAIAWSIAHPELSELPFAAMSELILAVGRVPIAKYARPGTADMGEVLSGFLPQNRVMILGRHGALSWGEDLEEAYNGMERLEHAAQILKYAKELGGITELPKVEVDALFEMRKKLGERTL